MDAVQQRIPSPLTEEQVAELDRLITQIPQVISIVDDCAECEIQIPGIKDSLERSLHRAIALKRLHDKHSV